MGISRAQPIMADGDKEQENTNPLPAEQVHTDSNFGLVSEEVCLDLPRNTFEFYDMKIIISGAAGVFIGVETVHLSPGDLTTLKLHEPDWPYPPDANVSVQATTDLMSNGRKVGDFSLKFSIPWLKKQ